MSTAIDTNTVSRGLKRVLVIAEPELAAAIYEALDPYIDLSSTTPSLSTVTADGNAYSVGWLCDHIFPSPIRRKTDALKKMWTDFNKKTRQLVSSSPTFRTIDLPMSLFGWGDFHFVIIQDLWPVQSSTGPTLECAGYVLANLDYYLWGNFGTKKIILVTDKTFPLGRVEWLKGSSLSSSTDINDVVSGFDRKQAFQLIDMGGKTELRERLIQLLKGGGDSPGAGREELVSVASGTQSGHDKNSEGVDLLLSPVMDEVGKALQVYVGQQAEVLIVDDELKDLNDTFKQLTGRPLAAPGPLSTNRVKVTTASDGIVQEAETFEALVDLCMKEFQSSASGQKPYTLLVTDILFRGPTWNRTGLDLIETLRLRLKQQEKGRRIGIVAYTAFTTPFIAMSSYQRGADFVVAKTDFAAHDLKVKGSQRLMMTLAFLCFQKSFLSDKRREANEIMKSPRSSRSASQTQTSLRQLQSVLPRHAVSLHLQQEWLDTCYLFEAMNVYDPGSDQLKEICKDVGRKYD